MRRRYPLIIVARITGLVLFSLCVFSCDDRGTGSSPPTTMPSAAAKTGMSQFSYLAADGGPHMLLPVDVAPAWSGVPSFADVMNPKYDYGRACAATTGKQIASISVGSGSALVFANPPLSAWGKSADGLVEVYDLQSWTSTDADALIKRATASVSTPSMLDTGLKLNLESPDVFLLYAGDTPTSTAYGVHRIPLPAGTYRVLSGNYAAPGEAVIIYRLQRAGT
jgi:hypothetical protein